MNPSEAFDLLREAAQTLQSLKSGTPMVHRDQCGVIDIKGEYWIAHKEVVAEIDRLRTHLAEVERERDVWKSKAEHRGRCASEMASWAGEMEAAAREVLSAAHLRTHGFPEGDISDLDFSKMLPAIVRLDAALSPAPAAGETKVSVTITEKPSGGICVDLSPNPSMLPDGDVKTTAQKIEKALASWGFINTIRTGYSATALKLAGQEEPDAGGAA